MADVFIKLNIELSPQAMAEALSRGIDAVKQADQRKREAELDNEARASQLSNQALARQIVTQKAEREDQMAQLAMEQQQIKVERERLVLQKERLEIEKTRIEDALGMACQMVDILHPGIDETRRALFIKTTANLLLLDNGKRLKLVLLALQDVRNEKGEKAAKCTQAFVEQEELCSFLECASCIIKPI